MDKDRVLHLLETADWNDIILRLTHYATWRACHYSWKPGKSDQLLGGKTPEDIALGAIEKVLTGTRVWDPEKYPDLLKHLMWIVNSDMEHLFSSMEHQKTSEMPESSSEEDITTDNSKALSGPSSLLHGKIPTPEEVLLIKEKRNIEEKLKNKLYELVEGDEDLEMLLLCFEEGIDKPETIAAQTGWDISKVYSLKRKLLRKAATIISLFRNGE